LAGIHRECTNIREWDGTKLLYGVRVLRMMLPMAAGPYTLPPPWNLEALGRPLAAYPAPGLEEHGGLGVAP